MRIIVAVMMLVFFTATVAYARIGEGFDQCVKRYGVPLVNNMKLLDYRTGLEVRQFKKEGVHVNIVFSGDKAVYLEYDYSTLKLETGESSANIIRKLLEVNGKDWALDKSTVDRDWLLEDVDSEGVIAIDKIEPGFAKDRWICGGGPEKGGLIAVKSKIMGILLIATGEYMELVMKNQPRYLKDRAAKVKKSLENF